MTNLSQIDLKRCRDIIADEVKIKDIVADICAETGVSCADIYGPTRGSPKVCEARGLAMFIAYYQIGLSFAAIGRVFGRHHASVAHSVALEVERRAQ